MAVDVLLGLQWGDEGKGKIVDVLAPQYDIIARFQGGPNAGHTLIFDGKKFVLHTVPSGIFRPGLLNLIGNGVVIDPITLSKELDQLDAAGIDYAGRLFVARKAHLILPSHRLLDAARENAKGDRKIGSTLKGIGPTYMDKTGRNGLRVGNLEAPDFRTRYEELKQKHKEHVGLYPYIEFDLAGEERKWFEAVERLKSLPFVDGEYWINSALDEGKKILAEGAQGSMLDIDFGTYPFVTSSNTITAGVCTGLGIAPQKIGEVIGITKAYCTRVGGGPFPTELDNEIGEFLRREGGEFGATTGRPRRCGWIDLVQLRYTIMLSGVTQLVVTKVDVLNKFATLQAADAYEVDGQLTAVLPFDLCHENYQPVYTAIEGWNTDLSGVKEEAQLPQACLDYVRFLEEKLGVRVSMVSTGPDREELVLR
ncbi:adenylosuccinate synthase [Neolewinella lacunae]|uniref:Adenylosuccinate synthetase n=1 Tax=Neolewinella lacunae TaxID=1517758 RepID=A0A923TAE6_9BACT|nr:adenylosuccinate synthase [Neolewinella lacunae]MBC6996429.1 adenylosuccinate synthase [Neolewinella lacunae]MDN3633628.1 adenylosuccinate synthase [Neolewinella lacunae]